MQASFMNRTMGNGLAYRLDARAKMSISLTASLGVIILHSPQSLGLLLAASLAYGLSLNRPKPLLLCHAFLAVMWSVAFGFMHLMQALNPNPVPTELSRLLVPFLRSAVMVNVILVMALSTRIQTVLTTLKALRLHRCIAIPAAVMIRFIPSFLSDVRQVSEALKTRGYPITPRFVLSHPLLATRLLIVPLVFRALRASDELGIAAELKGLGNLGSVRAFRPPRFETRDWMASATALACIAAAVILQVFTGGPRGGMF